MKTFVIGANGKIGRLFCQKAAEQGLAVRAMLRDPAQRSFFEPLGVETVLGDLEGEFGHGLEGCDRVVFTAGSGIIAGGLSSIFGEHIPAWFWIVATASVFVTLWLNMKGTLDNKKTLWILAVECCSWAAWHSWEAS